MLRMFARRMFQVTTVVGTDEVLFGVTLPSDTVIHDIKVKLEMNTTGVALGYRESHMYALEGWILPVNDPDAGQTYDNLWDVLVPKDTDVQTLDLDAQSSADTAPFYEAGEAEWGAMLDVGLRPERLYHRHKIQSVANSARLVYQDNQTPFAVQWAGGDSVRIHLRKRLRVRQPSALVFAIASPNLDDTSATVPSVLAEAQWGQVKYASHMLERAMLHLLGVVEAGAETPWEEATALLQLHLDPDVYEQTSAAFGAEAYDVFGEAIIDHSVKGEMGSMAITTGR